MTSATPFESDIAEQPDALRRLAVDAIDAAGAVAGSWDSIVLTGMGASEFASVPTWRRLVAQGLRAWVMDTGDLLENPRLVNDRTLLVITSQSGASGEIVRLLDRIDDGTVTPGRVVGIADDATSPLATRADVHLSLRSGSEATVSTKSYLNTLGVHRFLMAAWGAEAPAAVAAELEETSELVATVIERTELTQIARAAALHPLRRIAFIGRGDQISTARFAALITKESSKIPAEAFSGGRFRHGPLELSGDGLTAVFFGMYRDGEGDGLVRLATELVASGSQVVLVGDLEIGDATTLHVPAGSPLAELAVNSVVAELLAVELSRANGVVPGEFMYGSKITTAV